ncbi:nucleotidyltransferase domain-containing protein, partial [Leptospira interrogans serovar Pomona]|nr:nucleotidyltransferase domain-containing protein [Leptospira interrogans serovar Pomona]
MILPELKKKIQDILVQIESEFSVEILLS